MKAGQQGQGAVTARVMIKARLLAFSAVWLVLSACASSEPVIPPPPEPPISGDTFPTSQGDLIVHPVNHASFVMSWEVRSSMSTPSAVPRASRACLLPM